MRAEMAEFNKVLEKFPSEDDIANLQRIIKKYGIKSLKSIKSLTDHPISQNIDDLMFLYYYLNAQQKSSSIEKLIYTLLGGEKVHASLDKGDALINNKFYELKTSTTNEGDRINARQIRLYQPIDFYICSYIYEKDMTRSKVYLLPKNKMEKEVELMGGYTHGTKAANKNKRNPEYSITLNVFNDDNEHTQRWNENYWYQELYDKLNPVKVDTIKRKTIVIN